MTPRLEPALVELPRIHDARGNLTFVEAERHVPFRIARAYWIYGVPGGYGRGEHAYRTMEEFVIALSGSFEVVADDGTRTQSFVLSRSYVGLYLPPMIWRRIVNFSTNAVSLSLASRAYDPDDYVRDYALFRKLRERSR